MFADVLGMTPSSVDLKSVAQKRRVARAHLVKGANFPMFLRTAKFNITMPHLLKFGEFDVVSNK